MSSTKKNTKEKETNKSQVIRLAPEEAEQLQDLSERFSVTQAQLMRWAVAALAAKVKRDGGKLVLPLNLSDEGLG